jgi:hypothetical protein
MTDNVVAFKAEPLIKFCEFFLIQLIYYTPYYPQGNGLEESSNKILVKIKQAFDNKVKKEYF